MAAEIIEPESLDESTVDDLPASDSQSQDDLIASLEGQDSTQDTSDEDDIPEKYRGKSIKDIVSMHQEAEKLIGKHSGEVGELRQYVDGFIKAKLGETESQKAPEEEEVDFFEDPQKAVSKAIESHPDVQRARAQSDLYAQQTAMSALKEKHPDMGEVLQNPNFMDWVKASKVRTELFQRADKNYDFDCADELISQYKERSAVVKQATQTEQQSRQQAVKAASTGSSNGANTAGSKRVYRRADIIKLMKNDPDRYEALAPELMRAYQEGRVR
jgi:hypothetical protein